MKVNVDKCGIMHMRKKGVKRSGQIRATAISTRDSHTCMYIHVVRAVSEP